MVDGGCGDSALKLILLVITEWTIASPSPTCGIPERIVGIRWSDLQSRLSSIVGTGTIVRHEQNQRVFEFAILLQILNQASYFLIHSINHCGERRHPFSFVCSHPRLQYFPCRYMLRPRAWSQGRWQDSKLLLFGHPSIANEIPTCFVVTFVFCVILRQSM